jgi:adenine nucleotide transporter 17
MSQAKIEEHKKVAAASAAAQQSDNIAHALAGAGGGILSMVLTCALQFSALRLVSVTKTDAHRSVAIP